MVVYEIRFNEAREVQLTHSENEEQYKRWKKAPVDDLIVITATGRNIQGFKRPVNYAIRDYSIPQKMRKKPLSVIAVCGERNISDIAVQGPASTLGSYKTKHSVEEIIAAVIAVDKKYSEPGQIYYPDPLHKHPELINELRRQLELICAPLS